MKQLKVGVIGGGFGLKVQLPIINLQPNMEVIAVATMKRHELPETIHNENSMPNHYKEWKEMILNEELDLVFVSSMPTLHHEMAKFALENGVDVVCEKPFTVNSEESQELVRIAEENDRKLLLDFEWRFLPGRQKVNELLSQNKVGDILHFEYHMSMALYQRFKTSKPGWLGKKDQSGGMLGAIGSHLIDCMRWLTGSEVKQVNGLLATHVPEGDGEKRDADDGFLLQGVLENGSTFSIQVLTGVNHSLGSNLKVYGTEGTIVLEDDKRLRVGLANEELEEVQFTQVEVPEQLTKIASGYFAAFDPYLKEIYEYIANDQLHEDLPTGLDGHENQKVLDQIRNG
ncbi:Gfo/Idh/MocA family oxidoreductase [Filobacillus milosensis]|uniref:Gfo/Idh/MocA family oxidoreductase n=1 Tax=Filobacillus milosensis TaxID=94137 RepID=A0A4Y8IHR7_9BACI|nr:Gfo/Idh/MocA family oxidoreductase [Filobacillus milosensis]TFB14243.1 Gfo/Idh/MocA family oxidoreductase [Filobacillus milosensis]